MKSKLLYGIVTALIFILPFSTFLLVEALKHNLDYDYIVYGDIADLKGLETEDGIFIYSDDKSVNYSGFVTYNADTDTYGIELNEKSVIKIGRASYYNWDYENNELKDVKIELLKEKRGYSIPAFVIFALVGVLFAVMIISKKMKWHEKRPYEATIIALWVTLGFLFGINFFIESVFWAMFVITMSFTGHYVWHIYSKGQISKKEADKKTSQLEDILKKALGDRL